MLLIVTRIRGLILGLFRVVSDEGVPWILMFFVFVFFFYNDDDDEDADDDADDDDGG